MTSQMIPAGRRFLIMAEDDDGRVVTLRGDRFVDGQWSVDAGDPESTVTFRVSVAGSCHLSYSSDWGAAQTCSPPS